MVFKKGLLSWLYQSDLPRELYALYIASFLAVTAHWPVGENIYESDWDLAIVLDACRVDALREVSDEYEFVDHVDRRLSVGSTSKEWMVNTFTPHYRSEIEKTVYTCGNAWNQQLFDGDIDWGSWSSTEETWLDGSHVAKSLICRDVVGRKAFRELEDVSRFEYRYPGVHVPPARAVTDSALDARRGNPPDRHVVHYMQPHAPFVAGIEQGREFEEYEINPYASLRSGVPRSTVWSAYLDNLRHVLDEVELLVNNTTADQVVITADHGDLFGELGFYGHPAGNLHPDLRLVPWVETSATATGDYRPTREYDIADESAEERLRELGYL